jgi:hypothetical protein
MNSISRILQAFVKRFGKVALASFLLVILGANGLLRSVPLQAQTVQAIPAIPFSIAQAQQTKAASPSNAVLDWNKTAQTVVLAASAPAPQQYRSLAITHGAIFDAVNAIDRRYTPYAVDVKAPSGTSQEAAAASAGYYALLSLYPGQKVILDAAWKTSLDKIPEGESREEGIKLGKSVAEKLVALRSDDGADKKIDFKADKAVGVWQPTPPLFLPALLPHWSSVRPFVIKSANQFPIAAPLALDSDAYAKELNEVKRLGGRYSNERTPEQTAAGIFSAISPVVLWNTTAQAASTAKGLSLVDNARLFALLNLAGVDAYIAGYDVKYKYKLWRPVVAIPEAAKLGNPIITPDPQWESLIVTPNHPDYISGHTVTAGSGDRILNNFFGSDAVKVNIIFPANAGITRTYTGFSQISNELIESRIWAGVHTRTADVQGSVLGKQVGDYVFQNALRPLKS